MTLEDHIRTIVREELARALPARPAPDLLTTAEAAEAARVRPKTVRAWVAAGLPATRRGRRLFVARADLDRWSPRVPRPADELVSSLPGRVG